MLKYNSKRAWGGLISCIYTQTINLETDFCVSLSSCRKLWRFQKVFVNCDIKLRRITLKATLFSESVFYSTIAPVLLISPDSFARKNILNSHKRMFNLYQFRLTINELVINWLRLTFTFLRRVQSWSRSYFPGLFWSVIQAHLEIITEDYFTFQEE